MKEICINCKYGDGFKANGLSMGICLLSVTPFVCRGDSCGRFEPIKKPKRACGGGNA